MAQHDIPSSKAVPSNLDKKKVWTHTKLGINFPIGRIYRHIKSDKFAERISHNSAVFLASVLEYITAEVLEVAGEQCKYSKKSKLIKPRHISLAFRTDQELNQLVGDKTVVPMGGVVPFIHPDLRSIRRKSRLSRVTQTQNTQKTQKSQKVTSPVVDIPSVE